MVSLASLDLSSIDRLKHLPPLHIASKLYTSTKPYTNNPQSAIKSIKSIAPLLDRILVQRVKPEAKTATGIFLPETAVKELNEAKVLAVGPGAYAKDGTRVAVSVQPGDKVLIPQFGGSPIKVGEEELSLFRDHEYVFEKNMGLEDGKLTCNRLLAKINE
jgi:chaperonin GroES